MYLYLFLNIPEEICKPTISLAWPEQVYSWYEITVDKSQGLEAFNFLLLLLRNSKTVDMRIPNACS